MTKSLYLIIIIFLVTAFAVFAQETEAAMDELLDPETEHAESAEQTEENIITREDFWISIGADAAMYGISGLAYGGSFSFGYGSGSSMGLKATWFFSGEGVEVLEFSLLLRFYFLGAKAYHGPFIQLMGGLSLLTNRMTSFSIPSEYGSITAGLSFGWRFVFIDRFYIEPAVRGGYPFLFGAGVLAGIRF